MDEGVKHISEALKRFASLRNISFEFDRYSLLKEKIEFVVVLNWLKKVWILSMKGWKDSLYYALSASIFTGMLEEKEKKFWAFYSLGINDDSMKDLSEGLKRLEALKSFNLCVS